MWHVPSMAEGRHFIKEWRKHRGLTQQELADQVDVDRTYVSKIEKGAKRYDQPFLEAAAIVLGCLPGELIMREPTQSASVMNVWDHIPQEDRPQAMRVLESFVRKTGTAA